MESAKRILRKFGFRYAGRGASRCVYVGGPYAIKIEKGKGCHNESDNAAEYEFYAGAENHVRSRLAEPYYLSPNHRILLMERAEETASRRGDTYWRKNQTNKAEHISRMANILRHYIASCGVSTMDLHEDNIAILPSGKMVIIDYAAQNQQCCRKCDRPHSKCECCDECDMPYWCCECDE